MEELRKDERFAHIPKDPRFRTMSKHQRKVKIDNRFKSMFSDKKFKLKYSVDKRGKPMQFTTNENLKKYYELSESDHSETKSDSDEEIDSDDEDNLIAQLSEKSKSAKTKHEKTKRDKKYKIVKNTKTLVDNDNENNITKSESDSNKDFQESGDEVEGEKSDDDDEDESDSSGDDDDESDDDSDDDDDGEPDYARGEGLIESSSDDDDDDEDVDDTFDHEWGELDKNVAQTDELSRRLAVCNMDWDRIKALDLFVLLNSFKPANGLIKSVHIYPSEFGKQRMREEEEIGPTELKELGRQVEPGADDSGSEEDNEGNRYHREKLRQYQLNRLKYYYAVVECDSVNTASQIYEECDGKEYESSAARIDLRYIPDDMTFDDAPKSECTSLPDLSSYASSQFTTSALCQSKVDLTWDETDQDRIKLTMRKFDRNGDINEDDFKAYLASGSEDEGVDYGQMINQSDSDVESDEDGQIAKYQNLLKEIDDSSDKKKEMEMEVDWEPGLKETTEDLVKSKKKTKDQTPWESFIEKKKEKKKQRKAEMKKKRLEVKESRTEKTFSDDDLPDAVDLDDDFFNELKNEAKSEEKRKQKTKKKKKEEMNSEETQKEEAELALLMMDEEEEGKQHFSLKNLVEKKKKKTRKVKVEERTEDNFEMDMGDNRFDAVFKSHLYNIDPSAPEFKKTKGMEKIIEEKLKRRKMTDIKEKSKKMKVEIVKDEEKDELLPQKEESLSALVKSVKAKTQQFQTKKKKKRKN